MTPSSGPRPGGTPTAGMGAALGHDFDPAPGADRAVLLAHGAGTGRGALPLLAVGDALAEAQIPSLRFDYPYRTAGRKAPDRPAVLLEATRAAVELLSQQSGLPPERLVIGGRSMGGRYCSLVAGDADDPVPALGLVLLGYPLHPAGQPEKLRIEHFPRLRLPVLFVSGDRDAMAPRPLLEHHAEAIPGPVTFHWLPGADHGYRRTKAAASKSGVSDVLPEVAEVVVDWVRAVVR